MDANDRPQDQPPFGRRDRTSPAHGASPEAEAPAAEVPAGPASDTPRAPDPEPQPDPGPDPAPQPDPLPQPDPAPDPAPAPTPGPGPVPGPGPGPEPPLDPVPEPAPQPPLDPVPEPAPQPPLDPVPEPTPQPPLEPDPEPPLDPDSKERLLEESPDAPHSASRFDAGNGQGTVSGPSWGQSTQDRPILDGSTQDPSAEASVPNPHRGQSDPATIGRQPALNSTKTDRWLISSTVAAALVTAVLLILAQFDPVWSGVGIVVALVGLLAMLVVRVSKLGRRPRLRVMAVLLAVTWLVPLAVIISIMIGRSGQIWG